MLSYEENLYSGSGKKFLIWNIGKCKQLERWITELFALGEPQRSTSTIWMNTPSRCTDRKSQTILCKRWASKLNSQLIWVIVYLYICRITDVVSYIIGAGTVHVQCTLCIGLWHVAYDRILRISDNDAFNSDCQLWERRTSETGFQVQIRIFRVP